jgi:hypothetical protein
MNLGNGGIGLCVDLGSSGLGFSRLDGAVE